MNDSTELAPTNLIALRDGKQSAEALISTRFSEGLIDADELDRRLEAVADARTIAALERSIIDLVEPGTSASAALARRGPGPSVALARVEDIPAELELRTVFGELEQRGRWTPARRTRVVTVFGETELDLRDAALGPGETVIELRSVFAETTVLVPPGLAVRVAVRITLGAVERDPEIPSDPLGPDDPVVVITGRIFASALSLRERKSGERKKDARRRKKQERKAHKQALREGR